MKKDKRIKKNIIYGFSTKLITIALGIIIPRIFIMSFGSEVNGLISTITQIFTYLALLEAGIGNSTVNALYSPLSNKSEKDINEVMTQARHYYRKVSVFYLLSVLLFAIVYPLLTNTNIDYCTIFLLIIFQGFANCSSYYFCAVYDQLLMADGKRYIIDNLTFIIHIVSIIVRIVLIYLGFNILIVQGLYLLVVLLRVPITIKFCKKKYAYLSFKEESQKKLLKERKAFIVHEISATIFSNTDIVVISIFCNFAMASVYAIYSLIFNSLTSMINMANVGLGFLLGENVNTNKLEKIYDVYSLVYSIAVFSLMTTALIMTPSFIKLYTSGVTDVDYLIFFLPELFTIVSIMSGIRAVASRLITVSGHASKTKNRSIIEMIINIIVSIVLVCIMGIRGVLIGTIVALLYRSNDIIIYANKIILKRTPLIEYKSLLYQFIVLILIYIYFSYNPVVCSNYFDFAIYGLLIAIVVTISYLIPSLLFDRKKYIYLKEKSAKSTEDKV